MSNTHTHTQSLYQAGRQQSMRSAGLSPLLCYLSMDRQACGRDSICQAGPWSTGRGRMLTRPLKARSKSSMAKQMSGKPTLGWSSFDRCPSMSTCAVHSPASTMSDSVHLPVWLIVSEQRQVICHSGEWWIDSDQMPSGYLLQAASTF